MALPSCDKEIFQHGTVIAICAGPAVSIEAWIEATRKQFNVKLDWHYAGGRGLIKMLGEFRRPEVMSYLELTKPNDIQW